MRKSFQLAILASSLMAINAFAYQVKGTIPAQAKLTSQSAKLSAGVAKKPVVLMNMHLTAREQASILQYTPQTALNLAQTPAAPRKVQLGMNNVPVLDQGAHGTCATFANTAAVDAVIGKGDYVSQLCQLELGNYLEKYTYMPGGWNGSLGPIVLSQMQRFGIVNKTRQANGECGGVTDYPTDTPWMEGEDVAITDYAPLSENFNTEKTELFWEPLLDVETRFGLTGVQYNGANVVKSIKKALALKAPGVNQRVTFGVLLYADICNVGACASNKVENDTWAITPEVNEDAKPEIGGHEMIITGYDDAATVKDSAGKVHKGLFTLRNSWGSEVGDKGDFYMTYDYFEKFAMEAQVVSYAVDTDQTK